MLCAWNSIDPGESRIFYSNLSQHNRRNSPTKLLIVSHSAGLSGAELCLVNLAETALLQGYDVVVALPTKGPLSQRLLDRAPTLRVVYTPIQAWMGPRHHSLLGAARLLQCVLNVGPFLWLLNRENPDVVLINSSVIPAPIFASKLARKRTVVIVRESLKTNPMLRTLLPIASMIRLIAAWTDLVIANSSYVARQYEMKSNMIYPSLNEAFFDERSRTNRTEGPRHPGTPLLVSMLGTVSPEKGQVLAVEAIANARSAGADVRLTIIGGGRAVDIREMNSAIAAHELEDRVVYFSATDDPISEYKKADVTIVCSRNEAFGKVTIESILCGTPVVGIDAGGTAEILNLGGGNLVEASAQALANALVQLFECPRELHQLEEQCFDHPLRQTMLSSARDTISALEF